jgi:sugar transferase (PEP-CTERM/EpsH1 system associated)
MRLEVEPMAPARAERSKCQTLRVALVTSNLKGGGAEQCVVALANQLYEHGWRPIVISLGASGALSARIHEEGIPIVVLNKRQGNDPRLALALARALRRLQVEVVHANNWSTLLESVVGARLAGVRSIVHTQHGLHFEMRASQHGPNRRFRLAAQRLIARWLSHIVAVSPEVRQTLLDDWRVPEDKVSVILNGIPLESRPLTVVERNARRRELGFDHTDFVVGSMGFFRPVKDFPTLVRAMARVHANAPQARLALIGDGPGRGDLELLVRRLGLDRIVRFLGWRTDAPAILPCLDAFALCSVSEGISLALLEAMAAGVPIVATRVGGNPLVVQDGQTGWLVPPGKADITADAILALLRDPLTRCAMGRSGRQRANTHFSVDRMATDYERVYMAVYPLGDSHRRDPALREGVQT